MLAYVSAIQLISLSPVPMSGAGTSMPGPVKNNDQNLVLMRHLIGSTNSSILYHITCLSQYDVRVKHINPLDNCTSFFRICCRKLIYKEGIYFQSMLYKYNTTLDS